MSKELHRDIECEECTFAACRGMLEACEDSDIDGHVREWSSLRCMVIVRLIQRRPEGTLNRM
jgi:hypothetical protein